MAECVDLLEQGESSRPYIPRSVVERDRYSADGRLMAAYFNENPKYSLKSFRRRFRMSRPMFMRIVNDIISYPSRNPGPVPLHFKRMQDKQLDARGKPGFSTIQKCVCAIRQLAYGYNPDSLDEYLHMGEETARWMNTCVDQHRRTYNACTLDMKSFMASQACLEALIACTGLERTAPRHGKSPLFREIIEDRAPDSSFTVNGTHYKKGYYLADDIYPEWSTFVEDAGYAISSLEDGDDIDPIVLPEHTFEERIALHQRTDKELRDRTVHHALCHDLTEHVWRLPA
uniref:uncharacterized protein LOC122588221 n=1 Tax=Erigeron canadensis TaxID=72917 RepID=UPI001CB932EE|nr:uncharacterized protein LOC122588221 [Erigeron canadensis]